MRHQRTAIASLALSGVLLATWPEAGAAQGAGAECVQEPNGDSSMDRRCWDGGKRRGRWVIRLPDGEVREGAYVAGKKQGQWVIRLPDGGVQEGPYVAGEKQGRWVLRHADGTVEEGAVAGGVREGRWVAHRPDGSRRTFEMAGGRLVEGSVRVVARAQGGTRGAGAMTREERRRVQSALAAQGFDPGPADGVFGPRTRRAIQAWQASHGYAATGALTGAQAVGLHSPQAAPRRAQATAQGGSAELLRLLGAGWASVHEARIRELLRQGADPNATDGNGHTAVHYAAAHRLVYLRAVLAHGGRCGTKNRYGVTPLHVAAAARQVLGGPGPETVRVLLECAPGTLAERDHRGNTPLHAVYAGVNTRAAGPSDLWSLTEDDGSKDADVLKTLLDAEADPNARNRAGDTPMLLLLKEKGVVFTHRSQLRLLLNAGADPDTRDGQGTPAVTQAVLSQSRADLPDEGAALVAALLKAGADPDLRDRRGDTPLVHVAKFEEDIHTELAALLAGGADPCLADRRGKLPHELAPEGSKRQWGLREAGGARRGVQFTFETSGVLDTEGMCEREAQKAERQAQKTQAERRAEERERKAREAETAARRAQAEAERERKVREAEAEPAVTERKAETYAAVGMGYTVTTTGIEWDVVWGPDKDTVYDRIYEYGHGSGSPTNCTCYAHDFSEYKREWPDVCITVVVPEIESPMLEYMMTGGPSRNRISTYFPAPIYISSTSTHEGLDSALGECRVASEQRALNYCYDGKRTGKFGEDKSCRLDRIDTFLIGCKVVKRQCLSELK